MDHAAIKNSRHPLLFANSLFDVQGDRQAVSPSPALFSFTSTTPGPFLWGRLDTRVRSCFVSKDSFFPSYRDVSRIFFFDLAVPRDPPHEEVPTPCQSYLIPPSLFQIQLREARAQGQSFFLLSLP